MSALTPRMLKAIIDNMDEIQLDYPVGIVWSGSDQTADAKSVDVDGDGYVEILA